MISTRQEIAELIRGHGHRATPQRITIYEAIWNAGSHPSVAEIHKYASQNDPSISIATVYKTLHLFTKIGIIIEMASFGGTIHYDPNINPHFNLICKSCGKIEDYNDPIIESIILRLEKSSHFEIGPQTVEIKGICKECKKDASAKK